MSEIMEVFWRTLLAFVLFIGIARLLGKQTMSYLTLNHFIAAATLGSITGNLAFNLNIKTWHAVFAMLTFLLPPYWSWSLRSKAEKPAAGYQENLPY